MATRTERLDVRVTAQHKKLIERAALAMGQPVTSFVLASVLDRAREALQSESRTVLSDRDRTAFLAILDSAARPTRALARAVARSRKHNADDSV
ncbi:MAG: DUF1778 domain-containing protein [Planctomycetes bacterium]|nr:DUF1778 domain-containing protein [Planctomycetota bacterium]